MNKAEFVASFDLFVSELAKAEIVTKRELGAMSITLLKGIHGLDGMDYLAGEDAFVNRLLTVLSPANRKFFVSFFKHFSGYNYAEDLGTFKGKSKSKYLEALAETKLLMAGKHPRIAEGQPSNLWGWVHACSVDSPVVFDASKIAKFVEKQCKLAVATQHSKLDVLRAVFEGGFTARDVQDMVDLIAAEAEAGNVIKKAAGKMPAEDAPM